MNIRNHNQAAWNKYVEKKDKWRFHSMKQLLMLKKTEFDSLKAGFTLTDMYKDMRGDENKFDQNFTAFMATRAVKVVNKNENHV